MAELKRNCELCDEEASVYCPCDAAYLCNVCDDRVHHANFLVARHVRVEICRVCRKFAGKRISGVGKTSPAGIRSRACESCSPELEEEEEDDCVSSTSSSCVSSTSSSASSRRRRSRRRSGGAAVAVDEKVEGILVNWCRKMDMKENNNSNVVKMVVEVLSRCMGKMTILPFRVLLAAAFWAVIRTRGGGELTRLEQISGVPGQLIVATESRLARVVKRRQTREDHEEGWAES
ncbi:hypothetical protein RND81_04G118100 [Saponaria officinalis]|uniref:B box-type domain-containing protein n=1 Tax=Saponaria officinalis TaxID=3572 RepID=A0AAW1LIL1_SAPOF